MKKVIFMVAVAALIVVNVSGCLCVPIDKLVDLAKEEFVVEDEDTLNMKTETRVCREFSKLELDGGYRVEYVEGEPSITITAPAKVLDIIKLEQKGDEVEIYTSKRVRNARIILIVSSHSLRDVEVNGAVYFKAKKISTAGEFEMEVNGASSQEIECLEARVVKLESNGANNVEIKNLQCQELKLEINGTGAAVVGGMADKARVEINGVGSADVRDLQCAKLDVRKNGIGTIRR